MENSKIIELKNFSIGLPQKMKYGNDKEIDTGICKQTIEEAFLTKDGFHGDGVADLRYHGGPDRAVCVYPNIIYFGRKNSRILYHLPLLVRI